MAHKFTYLPSLNPSLFKPNAISADTRAFNAPMMEQTRNRPMPGAPGSAARGMLAKPPASPRARTRKISGLGGREVEIRVLPPKSAPKGVYLHLHGGGLVAGSADGQDSMLERIADATAQVCVDVEYRLAPEHPHPAAWDDCEAAALWLVKNAKAEFGTDKLTIGGESAGATLAVPVLVRMRDKHAYTGFQGANLSYGNYDTTMSPSQKYNGGENALMIRTADIQNCSDAYAPDVKTRRDPDISAIFANLKDMPPALISVGTLDPFLDDSLFMYARWIAAGNEAELAVYPGGAHGFNMFPINIAAEANAKIDAFLAAVIA